MKGQEHKDPNVTVDFRKITAPEMLKQIIDIFEELTEKKKPLHLLMIDKTREENTSIWLAYWWLKHHVGSVLALSEDSVPGTLAEHKEMIGLTLSAFKKSQQAVQTVTDLLLLQDQFLGRRAVEKSLSELEGNPPFEKLLEIRSIMEMKVEEQQSN